MARVIASAAQASLNKGVDTEGLLIAARGVRAVLCSRNRQTSLPVRGARCLGWLVQIEARTVSRQMEVSRDRLANLVLNQLRLRDVAFEAAGPHARARFRAHQLRAHGQAPGFETDGTFQYRGDVELPADGLRIRASVAKAKRGGSGRDLQIANTRKFANQIVDERIRDVIGCARSGTDEGQDCHRGGFRL